jgi:thiol:disulfide interchange protein DsbC
MRLSALAFAALLGCVPFLAQADDAEKNIRQALGQLQPDLVVVGVKPSPLQGLYEVEMQGGRLVYASADGKHVINGHLLKIEGGTVTNLTQEAESRGIAKQIAEIPAKDMVVFAPEKPKAHITVFTDPDCGYCRKLHSEVPELNRLGIEVRYLAFPRQGPGSQAASTLVSVWCAKDRQAAMTRAKSGQAVTAASCENPVQKQFELGQMLGVNGTPTVVLANGQVIPGYQPAAELARQAVMAR